MTELERADREISPLKSEDRHSDTGKVDGVPRRRGSPGGGRTGRYSLKTRWLAGLGVLLLVSGWWWAARRPSAAARRSLAVLSFVDHAPRPDSSWISTALSEMLAAELAVSRELRVIPGETIARLRYELTLGDETAKRRDAVVQIGKRLNVDFVVHGSYLIVQAGRDYFLQLDLRLHETQRGEPVTAIERVETEAKLSDLVSDVAAELRKALGVRNLSSDQQESVLATLPSRTEALRLYFDGLEKLRNFDPLAAKDSLIEAIEVEPSYALAHAVLTETWSALGNDLESKRSAARAYELASGFPEESYRRIEGRYFETAAEWPEAINTYRELWRRFPDNVDYGLRLAETQTISGKGHDALETVAELRGLSAFASRDPRIDLAESAAAFSLANYSMVKTAAKMAIEKGQALGASILVANAHRWQGKAHYQLYEFEQARMAFEESRRLFEEAGERRSVAEVLSELADVSYSQGDATAAVDLYHRALAIHQETGNRKGVSRTENSLGYQLALRGDLAAARTMLEDAVAIGRETGDRYSEANYLDNLIDVLLRQGDLEAAEELGQRERTIYRRLGNRQGSVWSHYNLGRIALAAGEVTKARDFHHKALVISDEIADSYWTAMSLEVLARDLLAAGELVSARRMSTDSRAIIRRNLGGGPNLASSQITSAEVLLGLQRPSEAEALARLAVAVYIEDALPDDQLGAVVVLVKALLAQGKLAEAKTAFSNIRARAATTQNPSLRLAATMAEAELLAAGGNSDTAIKLLEAAVAEAHRFGLISLELEARLAWGKLEIAGGGGRRASALASGRRRLETLEERAGELGCGLIARKAGTALAAIVSLPSWIRSQDVDDRS